MVPTRRSVLGALSGGGAAALTGCTGGDEADDCERLPTEPRYADWFADTSNYRGTCDFRTADRASVRVGARGNDAFWAFAPAAIAITPGTLVSWEWTGRGGQHDVESATGAFDSGEPVESASESFTARFEQPGVYRYFCTPHESVGMKGAVFVALE